MPQQRTSRRWREKGHQDYLAGFRGISITLRCWPEKYRSTSIASCAKLTAEALSYMRSQHEENRIGSRGYLESLFRQRQMMRVFQDDLWSLIVRPGQPLLRWRRTFGAKNGSGGLMKFILPFPPSVNTYWRSPNKGPAKGKHLVSAAGRKFKHAVRSAIIEQLRNTKPSTAPAAVEINSLSARPSPA